MIEFQYPELFLLALPLALLFRRWAYVPGATGWLRAAVLAVLLLAITGPRLNLHGRGLDVILVADRSRSLSSETQSNIRELVTNIQNHVATSAGDRLALVTFGSEARVEFELSDQNRLTDFVRDINPDGSDLHDALLTALDRVNPNRPARIFVLSDGESNGRDPLSAARRAREARVPVDCRVFERLKIGDTAVESVQLPESVVPREPFQFSVWIHSDRDTHGSLIVSREGRVIAEQERDFARGMSRMLFRDVLEDSGFYNYSIELKTADDPITENNRGAGVVRVEAGPRVLLLSSEGTPGNLAAALTAAKIPFDLAAAKEHPLTQDSLDRYRAVILENVPADDLGRLKMERLAQFVEDLGGGLLLTGGKRSFGTGGYFKSPLEDILPVSMELREEHKKVRVAIAIALDRSGSMSVPVKGGKVKMDLANLGTAACVSMLSPQDMVAVIAVDSSPHVFQPLTNVTDIGAINSKVKKIVSTGGGIYVYEALVAAGKELAKADGYATRHIILFSDAADSEVPGDYKNLLAKYAKSGITTSVIGLGTKADCDAKLLEDVALLGKGNIMFTADAEELPRLFTQDTMSIARNTFITGEDTYPDGIPGAILPDSRLIGSIDALGNNFPTVGGYNLSYLKPDATAAVVSTDENDAPWSAAWHRGLGRVAAITLEVDGDFSGQFAKWDDYENFLVTHARWLLGSTNPNQVFVKVDQSGQEAMIAVELDPDRPDQDAAQPPKLVVIPPGDEREKVIEPDFVWTGPHTLEARFRMDRMGSYRTLVKTDPRTFSRGPALSLPYSPEFAPRLALPEGSEVLKQISELTGGKLRTDALELFRDPPRTARTVSLLAPLMIAGICLLLLEIACRRLSLWERLVELTQRSTSAEPVIATTTAAAAAPSLWSRLRTRRERKPSAPKPRAEPVVTKAATPAATTPPPGRTEPNKSAMTASVFEKAKNRAKKRME